MQIAIPFRAACHRIALLQSSDFRPNRSREDGDATVGQQRDQDHRSGLSPLRGHAPDPARPARAQVRAVLSQGRVDPSDRQPEAPPRAIAVPVRPVQRANPEGHADHRSVVGQHRGVGGVLRAAAGPAVHCGDAAGHVAGEDRPDRVLRRQVPLRRIAGYLRGSPAPRGASATVTTWTSSPTRSGRPIGGATTTSPNRSSPRCNARSTRCRRGW